MAPGVSHQDRGALHPGTEPELPHHQGTAKVDPPTFALLSPKSPSWPQDLVEDSRKISHTHICGGEPFVQAGGDNPRDPAPHT